MEKEVYALGETGNDKHVLGPALFDLRHRLSKLLVAFGRRISLAIFVERAFHPFGYPVKRLEVVERRITDVKVDHLPAFRLFALRLHHDIPYRIAYDVHSFRWPVGQLPF